VSVFDLPVVQGVTSYEFQVQLDGQLFTLSLLFNTRDSFWYMDIFRATDATLLRAGIKVVAEWDLLRLYQGEERPAGSIIAVSQGAEGAEARTLEQLGTDVLLTYLGES
jgi:hypothetical protein